MKTIFFYKREEKVMKNLMNILLLFCLPFLMSFTGGDKETEQYCNSRFKYCIDYPKSEFKTIEKSDNADGLTFISKDGDLVMSVAGSFNVMNWTLDDIYHFTTEDDMESGQKIEKLETNFQDDFSETVFLLGDLYRYQKTYLLDNDFITVTIIAPKVQKERVDQMRNEVKLSINT